MSAPVFSVIIPARDEARNLPECHAALIRAAHGHSIETIVVINRCTDETESIAHSLGCKIVREDAKNLAQIRNAGARIATGEFIMTIDADSIVSDRTFDLVKTTMESGGSVGGAVMILPERYSLGILLTALCLVPYTLIYGISGGLFFCRRSDFEAIGGFDERLVSIEDIDFAKRLKRHGKLSGRKFKILWRVPIITSCRKFDRLGDWYFLLHPWKFLTLLKGRNQAEADRVWYDFEH